MAFVADLALVLLAALSGGLLAQRLGQPLIVGYILAGIVIGPFTTGPTVEDVGHIEQLAELGVVLLLFSLGLELSFRELTPVRAVALGGATIQIVLTIALGMALGRALGWPWRSGLWLGALVSLSSTMVVLKTIQAQGRLGTLSSRVMLGILVVQDLAVVPLTIVLPELSKPEGDLTHVGTAVLRAVVLLGAIVLFSTRVVPRLMAFVARWNSRELFFLATITLAVGVGYVAHVFGLSMALGAFVAGLVVNESEYSHQALSDVIPLRDLFGMLFFVSVGMLLNPTLVWQQLGTIVFAVAAVSLGKAAILAIVVRAFGYWNVVPLAAALTLFQVGEFAFVLARVGLSINALDVEVYTLVLNMAIITMVLTPVVSNFVPAAYGRFWPRRAREVYEAANVPEKGLSGHVVITGFGRVGRSVAEALSRMGLPFVLVESDDRRVQQARQAGLPIIYGDASQAVVLGAAGLANARALLVTASAFADVQNIVAGVRRLRPELPVMARADSGEAVRALYALGVEEVTSPEFEAAIEMTRQALLHLNVPAHEVLHVASAIRHRQYGGVEGRDRELERAPQIGEIARQLDLVWIRLSRDSPLSGRTLRELGLRSSTGASIVAIVRGNVLLANPDGSARLEPFDLVAVLGARDQIVHFERAMAVHADSTA
jgi:monovalent cation:H+ antiporter-2, CPA2 family